MKTRTLTGIAAVSLTAAVTLTGCGTSTGSTPTAGSGDSLGGTAKQQENREAQRNRVRTAAEEVQAALSDAGITAHVLVSPVGGGSVEATHPEATAVAAFNHGFDNLTKKGNWQAQSGGVNPAVRSAKKSDGCMAIGTHDFTERRPDTKAGDVTLAIAVICPVS